MKGIIDRIEGRNFTIELSGGKMINHEYGGVFKFKEGDAIIFKDNTIIIDYRATEERSDYIVGLFEKMKKK